METDHLTALAPELIERIAYFTPVRDLCNLRLLSPHIHSAVQRAFITAFCKRLPVFHNSRQSLEIALAIAKNEKYGKEVRTLAFYMENIPDDREDCDAETRICALRGELLQRLAIKGQLQRVEIVDLSHPGERPYMPKGWKENAYMHERYEDQALGRILSAMQTKNTLTVHTLVIDPAQWAFMIPTGRVLPHERIWQLAFRNIEVFKLRCCIFHTPAGWRQCLPLGFAGFLATAPKLRHISLQVPHYEDDAFIREKFPRALMGNGMMLVALLRQDFPELEILEFSGFRLDFVELIKAFVKRHQSLRRVFFADALFAGNDMTGKRVDIERMLVEGSMEDDDMDEGLEEGAEEGFPHSAESGPEGSLGEDSGGESDNGPLEEGPVGESYESSGTDDAEDGDGVAPHHPVQTHPLPPPTWILANLIDRAREDLAGSTVSLSNEDVCKIIGLPGRYQVHLAQRQVDEDEYILQVDMVLERFDSQGNRLALCDAIELGGK